MAKKKIAALISVFLSAIMITAFTGCGGSENKATDYKDGTYTGRSSNFEEDESGNGAGYGEAVIKIEGNKITECEFKMYNLDGSLKDESYGSELSRENRLKAQKAVQSAEKYAAAVIGKTLLKEDLDIEKCYETAKELEALSFDPRMIDLVMRDGQYDLLSKEEQGE